MTHQVTKVCPLLLRIGFTNVAGYLLGGIAAWAEAGFELASMDQMDCDTWGVRGRLTLPDFSA